MAEGGGGKEGGRGEGRRPGRPSAPFPFLPGAHAVASSFSIDSDIHPTWKVKKRALDELRREEAPKSHKNAGRRARPSPAIWSVCLSGWVKGRRPPLLVILLLRFFCQSMPSFDTPPEGAAETSGRLPEQNVRGWIVAGVEQVCHPFGKRSSK